MVVNNVEQNVYKAFRKMHIIGARDSLSIKKRRTSLRSAEGKFKVNFEDNLTSW
jgi:hypothetical protein